MSAHTAAERAALVHQFVDPVCERFIFADDAEREEFIEDFKVGFIMGTKSTVAWVQVPPEMWARRIGGIVGCAVVGAVTSLTHKDPRRL